VRNTLSSGTLAALALTTVVAPARAADAPSLEPYNVTWTTASDDSRGSMPLGNGDIGLNVWVEKGGDLVFYISKTDAWGDDLYGDYGLPKVGRVRVHLSPNPFAAEVSPFQQTLKLQQGAVTIDAGDPAHAVHLNVWVDANNPVIHLDGASATPEQMQVTIDRYRTQPAHGLSADMIFPSQGDTIAWAYRNTNTSHPALTNRTFGAAIRGAGLFPFDDGTLRSQTPQTRFDVRLYPLTRQTETPEAWHTLVQQRAETDRLQDLVASYQRHTRWWQDFWNRSWVIVTGNADADTVTRGYVLQRFVTACAGRGAFPIKFNGSLFTTDYALERRDDKTGAKTTETVTGDYRSWGGQYWFQNTRPMYWPMLASGDFDMMLPLFRMYADKLPEARKQVHDFYGHDGAYFAETNPFWSDLPRLTADSPPSWTNRYFTPILEMSAMMLDYYAYTGDRDFVKQTLVPVADAGITFFDQHFPRGADGKIYFKDDNAIETYWKVNNPAPDIAGLHYVIGRLLALPEDLTTPEQRTHWRTVQDILPALPLGEANGKKILRPFETADNPSERNGENPELYAVYPFRLYGLGKPDLALARDTFAVRIHRGATCWLQDPIHAAYIGDIETARKDVTDNMANTSRDPQERFPVFWGPFHDFTPDEDNGGNGMNALQLMLLQADDGKLLLQPAWPKEWDARFKLHGPHNTTIEGSVHAGKIVSLAVTPRSRRKDAWLVQPDGTLTPLPDPLPAVGK